MHRSHQLLVSVRSAMEARAALAGGADLIDVKEPDFGSLGRASDGVIAEVCGEIAGRTPVSAALGELKDWDRTVPNSPLTFVKWGLADCHPHFPWRRLLELQIGKTQPRGVIVAYADWQCAAAPPLESVCDFACSHSNSVLLLDTYCKDLGTSRRDHRPNLLDWLSLSEVFTLCEQCRAAGCRVALAGSLGAEEINQLLPAKPTWFAVRGAACEQGSRTGAIDRERVAALKELLTGTD